MTAIKDFVLHNVDATTVNKILKNLDVTKVSQIHQFSAKFLSIFPASINLSIKLDTFPLKCKIKPLFEKGIKTEAKIYRYISLLPIISKVIAKSVHDHTQYYLQRNELLHIYQTLEQVILQIHVFIG